MITKFYRPSHPPGIVDDYDRQHHRQIALMSSDDLGTFGDVMVSTITCPMAGETTMQRRIYRIGRSFNCAKQPNA